MKIYFAVKENNEPIYLPKHGLTNLLMSYHHYSKNKILVKKLISDGNDIFIDSGAFSAYNSGSYIDIDDYCKFLIDVGATHYAALDVIGDAQKTLENQRYMEQQYGLKPIPTFHMGEPADFALRLAENYDYIAIGGMVFSEGIEYWLDNLWADLLKINKNIKCHGFGMTNSKLIAKYPWYSIDSSSFKSGRRFGRLILFNKYTNQLITEDFNDWVKKYAELTRDDEILENSAFRYELTDVLSAKSYVKFVEWINSKEKDFSYLTSQKTLF